MRGLILSVFSLIGVVFIVACSAGEDKNNLPQIEEAVAGTLTAIPTPTAWIVTVTPSPSPTATKTPEVTYIRVNSKTFLRQGPGDLAYDIAVDQHMDVEAYGYLLEALPGHVLRIIETSAVDDGSSTSEIWYKVVFREYEEGNVTGWIPASAGEQSQDGSTSTPLPSSTPICHSVPPLPSGSIFRAEEAVQLRTAPGSDAAIIPGAFTELCQTYHFLATTQEDDRGIWVKIEVEVEGKKVVGWVSLSTGTFAY